MQQKTKYDAERVDNYWKQAVTTAEGLQVKCTQLIDLWGKCQPPKCEGIPAIPAAFAMVQKMSEMAKKLYEAAVTGRDDAEKYNEEVQKQIVNQGIHL